MEEILSPDRIPTFENRSMIAEDLLELIRKESLPGGKFDHIDVAKLNRTRFAAARS